MSLFTPQLSFLTLRPSIHEQRDSVVIRTGFLAGLFSLFLNTRQVEISPARQTVMFSYRRAYFFTSRTQLDFADVWYVDYSFGAMGTDWGWTASGVGRHDQVESFTIALVTRDERTHTVCAFRGEGSACTGWTGVLLGGDSLVDLAGTQDKESRKLAHYLAGLLGVTIGKPLDAIATMAKCPACGRPTARCKAKCLYCGAEIKGSQSV